MLTLISRRILWIKTPLLIQPIINFLWSSQSHEFLELNESFQILENLTVLDLAFLSFFIDCHNTIINSHKIQFIKDLNQA